MNSVLLAFHCFINRLPIGSVDDLLSMSTTVFDQLTPLSTYLYKLCTCYDKKHTAATKNTLFVRQTSEVGNTIVYYTAVREKRET